MSITHDADSLTNSVMQAMDKEFRKNGLAPANHRHYKGNRVRIRAMIAMMLEDAKEHGDVPRS